MSHLNNKELFMAQMINRGAELIRINAAKKCLEYSTDGGRFWRNRYSFTSSVGDIEDLTENGNEILATTSKGLYYSTDEGRFWRRR